MADAKSLFESGDDVTPHDAAASLFESGSDIQPGDKQYAPDDQSKVTDLQAAGLNWGGPVTGIKQGATLGFGDEIAALSGAAGAKSGGDKRPFWTIYKDILDSTRAEQKQVNTDHPISTTAGEFAGSLVSPLGLAGGVLAPAAADASFLTKAGAMAKAGAVGGAAIGLGNSTADLTTGDPSQIGQAAEDTLGSAVIGAGTGAALQGVMSAGSSLTSGVGRIVGSLPIADDVTQVFQKTRDGVELLNLAKDFSQKNRDLAESIINDMGELQQLSGEFMGMHGEELNKTNAKVDMEGLVGNIRKKLANLKGDSPDQKAEIEKLQKTLTSMLDEHEQTLTSFIKKPDSPTAIDNATRAENTVAQKTAEAEVADKLKAQQIQNALEEETNSEDPNLKEIARLNKLLKKVKGTGDTTFPAQDITDDVTGLPVKAVDRGLGKAPITSAIMPDQEPAFTPLQKIQRTQTVVGSPTADMVQAQTHAKTIAEGLGKAETHIGKAAYGVAKDELNNAMDTSLANATAPEGSPSVADSAAGYDAASGQFYNTVSAKEMLKLPKNYGPFDNAKKVDDINRIQNLIRDYHQGKQKAQTINDALDKLSEAYPGTAESIRRQISEGSQNEHLANQLSQGNEYTRDWKGILMGAGKSTVLQGARSLGKGAQWADNAANTVTRLGTNVYNSSPQNLQVLADAASGAGKSFANVLNQVVNSPMAKRKALLFTLMQQQDFRDFAHAHLPSLGNGDSDH